MQRQVRQKVDSIHDPEWRPIAGDKEMEHLFFRRQLHHGRDEATRYGSWSC